MFQMELKDVATKSCKILNSMGTSIQWVESYVTGDKVFCVYNAANEGLVREHAEKGGFPADSITEVKTIIDPTTADIWPSVRK